MIYNNVCMYIYLYLPTLLGSVAQIATVGSSVIEF